MFKLKHLYLLVLAIPLILAGCFEYDQEMVIDEDGSGTVKMHYRIPLLEEPLEEGPESYPWNVYVPEPPFSEYAIIDSFGGVPLVVKDVRVKTVYGDRDASYSVLFENVEDLNGRGIFNFEEGKFAQVFSLREEGDGVWTYEHTIDFDWPLEDYGDHEYYTSDCDLTYQLKVPGEIVEHNGAPGPDNTVRWKYTLEELLNTETTLTATYRMPETAPVPGATEKDGKLASWVLGVIILCGLIAAGILMALLKRNRFLFMGGVVKTLEKRPVCKIAVGASLVALAAGIILLGVVLYLYFWSVATDMAGVWQYAGYAYAVILGIIIYMAAHATILRAKFILELPESDYMIIPIVSRIFRLAGELGACGLLAVAILRGGVALLLRTAAEAAPASLTGNAEGRVLVAGLLVIFAFASLIISYLAAEVVAVFGNIAREAKPPKNGDRSA